MSSSIPTAISGGEAGGIKPKPRLIAFVCTRDPDYSRVAITRRGLESGFEVIPITSEQERYSLRIISVIYQLIVARLNGQLRRCDAVFVGFFAQPIFPIVRLLWRGTLLSDAYFSFYDTLILDKKTARPGSLKAKLAFWLDRFMIKHSDCLFTDTCCHAEYFRKEFEQPEAPIYRLWISAQNEIFDDWKLRTISNDEVFEVFFWGGFIPLQGVEFIINAAAVLKDQRFRFTIFGNGQTFDAAVELKENLGLDNVEFHDWQPIVAVRDFAKKAHLALGIFGTTEKAARVIPNKLFEAIAMGIPVITADSPAVRELLEDGHDVMLCRAGDADSLADRIRWARSNFKEAIKIGQRGKLTFERLASPDRVAQDLVDRVNECIDAEANR